MNPCEYLARVAFDSLSLGFTHIDTEDYPEEERGSIDFDAERRRKNHAAVANYLAECDEITVYPNGRVKWAGRAITWPERVPDLVTC